MADEQNPPAGPVGSQVVEERRDASDRIAVALAAGERNLDPAGSFDGDRIGRRAMLIGGLLALTVTMVGQAFAGDFFWVAVWATLGGACCGTFTGVVFARSRGSSSSGARMGERNPASGQKLAWLVPFGQLTMTRRGGSSSGAARAWPTSSRRPRRPLA